MIGRPGRQQQGSGYVFAGVALSMMVIFGGLVGVTVGLGPASIPIWFMAVGGFVFVSRGPIGQALAARIHPPLDESSELEQFVPPELYAELDELRGRVSELEERQEFSERLLSRRAGEQDPA